MAEIIDNMVEMKKYCHLEDIHYVSSDLNPADLATRGNVLATDLGPFSYWQKRPKYLRSRRQTCLLYPMWHMGPGQIMYMGPGSIRSLGPDLFITYCKWSSL